MQDTAAHWISPADPVRLAEKEIHIWRIRLDPTPNDLTRHVAQLDPDERARAGRFHFPHDRARFIAAHSALRVILSRYLDVRPVDLAFGYTRFGKPFIQEPPQPDPKLLAFNMSHSHDVALVAVGRDCALGIDIERIRPELAEQHIAERFFAPSEVTALRHLPSEAQAEAFFNCWTRKEAFVKARGEGLSLPLDRFAVSLTPGAPAVLLAINDDPHEAGQWHMQALMPWPGYAAALVTDCTSCHVATYHYNIIP